MIGQTVNNYILERKLGEGGMGDVYFARHNRIDRVVAIKVLHKNLFTNESIRSRFKNEANALIKLGHLNIVKIYDYVEQDDFACLIMEYIEGFTLDDYITKVTGPLPAPKATNIICSVLDAVQYAHDNNIFHRDIKPGNIMVSKDGKIVRIMDFSIAKFTDVANLKTTHANAQLGTPFYMSPEQVKGMTYTALSDIYSLGVTLFEMVTGKCPYLEITNLFELQSKIVNEPLPPTNKYYPEVSLKIQEAIKVATNKIPEERFKSCREFKTYLLEEEKLRPVPLPPQTQQPPPKVQQPKPEAQRPQRIKSKHFAEENKKSKGWFYVVMVLSIIILGAIVISFLNKPEVSPPPQEQDTTLHRPDSVRNIPMEANTLISQRETMMHTTITDSIKRDQLKEKLIDLLTTSNTSRVNSILDSAFPKKTEPQEPLPTPPAPEKIINDLVGQKLSNGLHFTEKSRTNIKRKPNFINNCNCATLDFTDENSESLYRVTIYYEKNDNGYVYKKNDCKKMSPFNPPPIPPRVIKDLAKEDLPNEKNNIPSDFEVIIEIKKKIKGKTKICEGYSNPGENQLTDFEVKRRLFTEDSTGIKFTVSFKYKDSFSCTEDITYNKEGEQYKLNR